EIVVVAGDHHDPVRPKAEERDGRSIDFRARLVAARVLRRDDAVPRQAREPRKLDHPDEARIGERRQDVPALQAQQARDRVGPGREPPPYARERSDLVRCESGNAMSEEELLQALPVDRVDGDPWALALVHLVHGRTIDSPPLVEKPNAVE